MRQGGLATVRTYKHNLPMHTRTLEHIYLRRQNINTCNKKNSSLQKEYVNARHTAHFSLSLGPLSQSRTQTDRQKDRQTGRCTHQLSFQICVYEQHSKSFGNFTLISSKSKSVEFSKFDDGLWGIMLGVHHQNHTKQPSCLFNATYISTFSFFYIPSVLVNQQITNTSE